MHTETEAPFSLRQKGRGPVFRRDKFSHGDVSAQHQPLSDPEMAWNLLTHSTSLVWVGWTDITQSDRSPSLPAASIYDTGQCWE